ncbi:inorganic phosphate transporter, partial [Candidatus Bipolaricaulota bacterium]|nr:inorganic phosphate transporter [Candidatus Bipolaricaulota bacterium]
PAVVGGVVGIGLVKGVAAVNLRQILAIVVGWVLTPVGAGLVGYVLWLTVGRALSG